MTDGQSCYTQAAQAKVSATATLDRFPCLKRLLFPTLDDDCAEDFGPDGEDQDKYPSRGVTDLGSTGRRPRGSGKARKSKAWLAVMSSADDQVRLFVLNNPSHHALAAKLSVQQL